MKRRMSIERLAACHVAVTGKGRFVEYLRETIPTDEVVDLVYGQTFGETLDLNRAALDLYEEEAHVRRLPAREVA